MENKYTMAEFEEMFMEAQKVTMNELEDDFKKVSKECNDEDNTFVITNTIMSVLSMATLYKNLFKKEEPSK